MAGKRKLPMIASRPDEDADARPPSHWIGFGLVAIFTLWAPFAAVAEAVKRRAIVSYLGDHSSETDLQLAVASLSDADRSRLAVVVFSLPLIALALAATGGGYLVGRFGGQAGKREAALAGAGAALVATGLAWLGGGVSLASLLSIAIAVPFAALGARLGIRARPARA